MSIEVAGRQVTVTNLDRVLWPKTGFTKGDLLDYYAALAPYIVPHLAGRPVMLGRWPDGVEERGWGQFDCRGRPPWMRSYRLTRRAGGDIELCVIDDAASLLWAANQGTIELHLYGGRVDAFEEPRAVILDLDPGPGLGARAVASVSLELRERLRRMELASVVKTSGSGGLHVLVPLNVPHSFDATRTFARRLARQLATDLPELVVGSISRAQRAGHVYVDWAQNTARRQLVAPYSLRATDVPMVSTPLRWNEVEAAAGRGSGIELAFGPEEVRARVEAHGDLFEAALSSRQQLPA